MPNLLGNDVSRWQGDINFTIYKNNSNFLIIKASEGVGFIDPSFNRNQTECRKTSLGLGYYHFARPDLNNTAEAEADYFLRVCGGLRAGEMLILDYEPNTQVQAHVDWCRRWLDYVYSKTGVRPLIYLNQSQVKKFNWKSVIDGGYGLWIAAYTYDPNNNEFEIGQWPFAAMQQWTNKQNVPGISGDTDGNVFFGDMATFKKYGYQATVPVDPSGCLVQDTPENRTRQQQLTDSDAKWKETLKILDIQDDPYATPTDKVKSVVGGYKSRETDLNNKLIEASTQIGIRDQEIANRKEQVSRLEAQLLDKDNYYSGLIDALNKQLEIAGNALPLAQARIGVLEGQLNEANKDKGRALLDKAEWQKRAEACESGVIIPQKTWWQRLLDLLTKKEVA